MKNKIRYTDAPKDVQEAILRAKVVTDFLPPPEQLRLAPIKIKITIALNKKVIDFFKREAAASHVKYQTMINEVLEQYVAKYSEMTAPKS